MAADGAMIDGAEPQTGPDAMPQSPEMELERALFAYAGTDFQPAPLREAIARAKRKDATAAMQRLTGWVMLCPLDSAAFNFAINQSYRLLDDAALRAALDDRLERAAQDFGRIVLLRLARAAQVAGDHADKDRQRRLLNSGRALLARLDAMNLRPEDGTEVFEA
jgi:hypothetical protein